MAISWKTLFKGAGSQPRGHETLLVSVPKGQGRGWAEVSAADFIATYGGGGGGGDFIVTDEGSYDILSRARSYELAAPVGGFVGVVTHDEENGLSVDANGVSLNAYGDGASVSLDTGAGVNIHAAQLINIASEDAVSIYTADGGTGLVLQRGGKLAFFNATPVSQPAAPTSAQDIADALADLGLIASGGVIGAAAPTIHLVGDTGEPAFENGYSSPGQPVRFYKDGARVYLEGTAVPAAGGSSFQVVFTLPAGFRPAEPQFFACSSLNGSVNDVLINTDGTVKSRTTVLAGGFSLSGVGFLAA